MKLDHVYLKRGDATIRVIIIQMYIDPVTNMKRVVYQYIDRENNLMGVPAIPIYAYRFKREFVKEPPGNSYQQQITPELYAGIPKVVLAAIAVSYLLNHLAIPAKSVTAELVREWGLLYDQGIVSHPPLNAKGKRIRKLKTQQHETTR